MAKKYGDWEVLKAAKEGGQAHVFKVKRPSDEQLGALKRLKNPKRIERFRDEIKAAKTLSHPNIAKLIDVDSGENPEFAVFDWEEGGTLADIPEGLLGILDLDTRLLWCEQIAYALAHAHSKGVIHRDIKPDNILISLDHGLARLCDFGLVYFEDGERVTATMEQVGSRYYIAPESEDGRAESIGPSTDLYSLGKLLYYVASGGKIFARERQRQESNVLSSLTGNPFLEHVATLVDELVIDEPSQRLQSAAEVAARLKSARRGVQERFPCMGFPSTYLCVFCRNATYQFITSSKGNSHNKGYPNEGNIGNEYLAYYECPNCGNSQRFKLKYSPQWFTELQPTKIQPKTFQMRDGITIKTG
jgi:serine/threonine protein kinase